MGNVKFEWNKSSVKIIHDLGFGKELNKEFANLVAAYSEDYVPFHEGDLSYYVQTFGAKDHGTVTYQVPYSKAQYQGYWTTKDGRTVHVDENKRDRRYHPLATSRWTEFAWSMHGDQIIAELNRKRKDLAK